MMFDDDEFGRLIRRGIATQAPPEEYWPAYETRLRARLQAQSRSTGQWTWAWIWAPSLVLSLALLALVTRVPPQAPNARAQDLLAAEASRHIEQTWLILRGVLHAKNEEEAAQYRSAGRTLLTSGVLLRHALDRQGDSDRYGEMERLEVLLLDFLHEPEGLPLLQRRIRAATAIPSSLARYE